MPIPEGDMQEAEYWLARLRESMTTLAAYSQTVSSETQWRKTLAYGLKGIAIFGGLAIATGWLPGIAPQIVAVVIAIAVAFDQLFSNHARLLAVDQAKKALRALEAGIEHRYNLKIAPVVGANKNGDTTAARQQADLAKSEYDYSFQQRELVVKALENADTAALKKLTLEAEAKQKG